MRFQTLAALACATTLMYAPVAFAGEPAAPPTAAAPADAPATLPDATISADEPAAPAADAAPAATPASSADFAGTWGTDAAQCAIPQDQQNAPMVLNDKGFDQHETHCAFTNIETVEGAWKVQAACSVEGDEQPAEFKLSVKGDTLTMEDEAGSNNLIRCKS
jgi:hypothetical protein